MTVEIRSLNEAIGVEVLGVDVSQSVDGSVFAQIHDALLENSIALFRGQEITIPQHLAFAERFGELETHTVPKDAHPNFPQVLVLSNLTEDGKLLGSPPAPDGGAWHSDYSYKKMPASVSLFYSIIAPEVHGDTMFSNMYAAYEALPETLRIRVEGLKWHCDRLKTQERLYPGKTFGEEERRHIHDAVHPIVRTHPITGRKALYLAMRQASLTRIEGLSASESIGLVEQLRDFATASRFVYSHRWKSGDLMIWDNRSSIHRATPWNQQRYQRHAHRVTVKGDEPF